MAKRRAIPKAVQDKLLVEAMHRCCLCPEHADITEVHHIDPISEGGPNSEDNLIVVCSNCHSKIHRIRNRYNPKQLQMYKERWVELCALGLPLDTRIAQAFDYNQPPSPLQGASLNIPDTILIPAGPFWRGSPPGGPEPNETPRLKLDLSAYRIGRYPVTNAQYACFLAANPDHPVPYLDEKEHRPYNWNPETRTYPDGKASHPIVLVSLQDAMDYCHWLSKTTGQHYRLPREEEWEKAARGTWPDERNYPWGEWRADYCNTQELGRCCTSDIHEFERTNQSPLGVVDMTGNVWEWTASPYRPYPDSAYKSSSSGGERNVVRGGSWGNFRDKARVSFRGRYKYDTRRPYLGFRAACDVVPSMQPQMPKPIQPEISWEMIDPAKLRQTIVAHFDRGDMEILCHDLNLHYGNLSRSREDTTAKQIVDYCKRDGRLVELLYYCKRERSHVDWQSIVRKDNDK